MAAPPRPRLWSVLLAYSLLWVSILVGGVVMIGIAAAVDPSVRALLLRTGGSEELLARPVLLIGAGAISALSALVVALIGGALSPMPISSRLRLGPSRTRRPALVVAAAVIGGLGLSEAFDSVLALIGLDGVGVLQAIQDAVQRATVIELVAVFLVLGVLAPVGEELFCRGYLQTRLSQRWGMWGGIASTAVLFGLLHADSVHTPFAIVLGLYLGWLTEATGSVRAALAAHLFNNVLSVVMARYPVDGSTATRVATVLVCLVALAAAVAVVRRYAAVEAPDPQRPFSEA